MGVGTITGVLDNATEAAEQLNEKVNVLSNTLGKLSSISETIGKGLLTGTSGFDDLTVAAKNAAEVFGETGKAMSSILGKVPGMSGYAGAMSAAFGLIGKAGGGAISAISDLTKETILFGDSISKPIRDSDKSMFELTKSFGMGIDAARGLTDSIPTQALTDFSRSMFLSTGELRSFLTAAGQQNMSIGKLTEGITTAYGELDFYTVATAQASAAGISASQAAQLFDTMISRQGMSTQQASETMAGFSKVAEETGINFQTVSRTLNDSVSNFTKLGMTADFGRPILESFAKTVKDVGLGIDVATESTTELVRAMGGLSSNYGLAYMTQLRGGGGASGGVLSSSIEMRQNMREAEATGDQGAMALETAKQMKEMIASMTGGNIITLEQASKSPDLQSQFYMQGQMLSQYGINDTSTQDAVLDLLSRMDQASAMGDTQGQKELAEQLSKEIEGRDKTMGEMDKLNISVGSLEAQLVTTTRDFGEYMRELIAETGRKTAEEAASGLIGKATTEMGNLTFSKEAAEAQKQGLFEALRDFIKGEQDSAKAETDSNTPKPGDYKTGDSKLDKFTQSLVDALKVVLTDQPAQKITIDMTPEAKQVFAANGSATINTTPGTGS
jgi:hypothetical protein